MNNMELYTNFHPKRSLSPRNCFNRTPYFARFLTFSFLHCCVSRIYYLIHEEIVIFDKPELNQNNFEIVVHMIAKYYLLISLMLIMRYSD